MDKFNKIKESLKRNLKNNKNVGYSKEILIIFLMTGGIFAYAKEDKYSQQIFFSYRVDNTKNLDNTLFNFNTQEYEKDNLINNPRRGKGLISRYGKFFGGNGIVLDNVNNYDTVSFAANIKLKNAPSITLNKPETKDVDITNITTGEPEIKDINLSIDNIDINVKKNKTIQDVETPVISKIDNIDKPNDITVESINSVGIKDISTKNVNVSNISSPSINVFTENIGIKPTYISTPTVPELVKIDKISVHSPEGNPVGANPTSGIYEFLNNNNGNLTQVSIKKGTFTVEKNKTNIKDYEAVSYDNDVNSYTRLPINTKLEFKDGRTATLKFQEKDFTKVFIYDDDGTDYSGVIEKGTIVKLPDGDYEIVYSLNKKTKKITDENGNEKEDTIPYEIEIKMEDGSVYKTLIHVKDNYTWSMGINLPDGKKATVVKTKDGYRLKNNIIYNSNSEYFYTILNTPYAEFSKDVVINYKNYENTGVINFESEGSVEGDFGKDKYGNLDKYENKKYITSEKKEYLKDNQKYYGVSGADNGKTELLFINKGNINLIGDKTTYMVSTNAGGGNYRTNYVDNEGKINANGKNTIILNRSADGGANNEMVHIFSNSENGEMIANGENSVVYMTSNGNLHISRSAFINDGLIQLNGKNSIGVFYTDGGQMGNYWNNTNTYLTWIKKPIEIRAEGAKGFVIQNAGIGVKNPKNLFKAKILENSSNSIGILQDIENGVSVTATKLEIDTNSSEKESKNIGIYANKGIINIVDAHEDSGEDDKTSSVTLKGNGNIGVFATGNNSEVNFNGLLKIEDTDNSKNNKLAVTTDGGKVNLDGSIKAGEKNANIKDSISLYSSDENSVLTLKDTAKKDIYLTGKSYIAYSVNNGKIDIIGKEDNKANLNLLNDDKNRKQGIGLIADKNGKINVSNADVTVKYGELGIGALHGAKIDFKNSDLKYTGNGYAVYADNDSKVDISSSNIELRDGAVAFEIDGNENTAQNIIMDNNTRIKPMEDGITIFNIKNFANISTVGGLKNNILNIATKKLKTTGATTTLENLVDVGTDNNGNKFKYKIAAIDGGTLTIGNLDKSGTIEDGDRKDSGNLTDEQKAKRDGYQFYNLIQAQRLNATTVSGSKIKALIDSNKAKDFNDQVVALEMNSSTNAKDNSDTKINLVNTSVEASRTDKGNGAIGLFINYGQVNVDNQSSILVENESKNKNGVGIYALNGSKVVNNGSITVGGKESVGILAKSYREDNKGVIKDEFGKKTGQGTINVENNKEITMNDNGSVGIYADNNNVDSNVDDSIIKNSGDININSDKGIGIYGKKVSISNEKNINISNNGTGIYSDNSKLKNLGKVTFNGNDGVGIYLKGKYDKDLDSKTLNVVSSKNTKNNIGVCIDDENDVETTLKINATGENITNYYSKGNITVKNSISVTKGGIGISASKDKKITYETSDDKALDVNENAIGIYGDTNNINLNGKLNLNKDSKGIYANAGTVNINNLITFNDENSFGVQALSNAVVNIKNEKNIDFNNKNNNIGYYLSSSTINFEKDINLNNNSNNTNIYAYGKENSNINLKNATIDGSVIGIYLDGTNTIKGTKISALNNAIGIYNNDKNEISNLIVEGKNKGIGIYSEKNIDLNNITPNSDNAVAVYSKGEINVKTETNLGLKNKGVGLFLDETGSLTGEKINVTTDGNNGVAVYYKGNKQNARDLNSYINVKNQKNVTTTYISDSNVINKNKIEIDGGENNIGSYIADDAIFTNNGTITLNNVQNGNAIYAYKGEAINSGDVKVYGEKSVAMVANKGGTIKNSGNIVNDENVAMYLNDGIGENTGSIISKIGVYAKGENAQFTNSKEIKANNIGIYLDGTKDNKIKLNNDSKLILTKNNSIGVYANNSIIDFDINPDIEGELKGLVSLYAIGNTNINSKITTAKSDNSTAVYLNDKSVKFGDKVDINITEGKKDKYNTGIYTGELYNGDLNVDLNAINPYIMGLRIGEKSTVTYTGSIKNNGENTIGILSEGKFTSSNKAKFDTTTGVGIYITKGETTIDSSTFNLSDDATSIHHEGGTLNLEGTINAKGNGTLLSLKNIDESINSNINLESGTNGILASYDDEKEHKLSLNEGKTIKLKDDSVAISAISKNKDKVTVENKGNIENEGKSVGIYAKNVKVVNSGKIDTNKGIYLTEKSDLVNSGNINLSSINAKGILGYNLSDNITWKIGKVLSTGKEDNNEKQIGVFVENNTGKLTLEGIDIKLLGTDSKGIIFRDGKESFDIKGNNNKIDVAYKGVGLASINTEGKVDSTDISLGNEGTGIYLKGEKTLNFKGSIKEKDNCKGSTLVSVSDKGQINLDVNNLIVSEKGIGLAAVKESKIFATKDTDITVNGGIGVYVNNSEIKDFNINVNSGVGLYVDGKINGDKIPNITLNGNDAKAYVLKDLDNKFKLDNLTIDGEGKNNQVGIYTIGSGKGLEVENIKVTGIKNYGIFNTANQEIESKNVEVSGKDSIGIYSNVEKNINISDKIDVNNGAIGICKVKGKVINSASIKSLNSSIGIYVKDNSEIDLNNSNITLDKKSSIGVKADNSKVVVNKKLEIKKEGSGDKNSVGIYSLNGSTTTINEGLKVESDLLGIYQLKGSVTTKGDFNIDKNGTGIFGDNTTINSNSNLNVSMNAKGIYAEKTTITSNGEIKTTGNNAIGISTKDNSEITQNGELNISGEKSVGIYGEKSNIIHTGKITVNDNDGIGIYGSNNDITNTGDMDIKSNAIGIFKEGKGTVTLNSDKVEVLDKGYAVHYDGLNKENSKLIADIKNMTLNKESVGVYTNNVDIKYTGNIHVGESTIKEDGFKNFDNNINSVGIYAKNSKLEYKGNIIVDKPLSVGIYAKDSTDVEIKDGSNINVSNGAFGIMTSENSNANITIDKGAVFNVTGRALDPNATKVNVSTGVATYGGTLTNNGTFNVSDGALGIYYNENTTFINNGTYNLTSGGVSDKHITQEFNIASSKMRLIKNGKIILNVPNKMDFVNSGVMNIDGGINLKGLQLNLNNHMHIDANEFEGIASIKPGFSNGDSTLEYVYKDIFRLKSNNDGLGKFMGDVKSQSITWIAKIGKVEKETLNKVDQSLNESETKDIIMTRIPYTVLIKSPKYNELAKGLDKIRLGIPKGMTSKVFKSLDEINNYGDLSNSIANIRGDMYSNIQERVLDISNEFDKSYDELLESNNKTRKVHKLSVIYSKSKHTDDTIGVSSYDRKTMGLLYLNDKENEKGDSKFGYSLGFTYSKFNFIGDTSKESNEKVYSGKLGVHYQKEKNNFKFLTKLNLGLNYHIAKRMANILNESNDKYTYNSRYWSMSVDWKNKLSYDININPNFVITPYAKLDAMYVKIFNIKENGDDSTLALNVKANNSLVITPKIGLDVKYDIKLKNDKYIALKGELEYRYDILPLYKKPNKAEFQKSNTWYDLSIPGYRRNSFKIAGEIEFGKKDKWGISLQAAYENAMKYGLRFNYKW